MHLGGRLFQIEENVAGSVANECIPQTYKLDPAVPFDPFRYLIGWEHYLGTGGVHTRVETTVAAVKLGLACLYAGSISGGLLVLSLLTVQSSKSVWSWGVASTGTWALVWFALARYLYRIKVAAHDSSKPA